MNIDATTSGIESPALGVMRARVHEEQLRVFMGSSRSTIVAALALGLITAIVLWPVTEPAVLVAWLNVLFWAYVARFHLTRAGASGQPIATSDFRRLDRFVILSSALTGAAWGTIALLSFESHHAEYEVFLGFVICGVTASATPSLGTHARAAFAFVLPCVFPLAVRMFQEQTPIGLAMGLMILLYLVVFSLTVRRIAAGLAESVRLRVEADARGTALAASRSELQQHQRLMAINVRAQGDFIGAVPPAEVFSGLLRDLVELTGSGFAFVAKVHADSVEPAMETLSVIDRQWTADDASARAVQTSALIDALALDVGNLRDLMAGQTICVGGDCNLCFVLTPDLDPLRSFVALPLFAREELVGVIGLGRRDGAFGGEIRAHLQPLATTVAQIILAMRVEQQRSEAESRLDRARGQLEICVTDAPAAVAMFDRGLRFVACSQRWLHDFGQATQSVYGRALYDTVPEIPARWREAFARVLDGQVERVDEDPFIRGDGTVRWLRWEVRPWYEPGGGVGGLVMFSEDVTEQKKSHDRLHARERLLEQLTDRVPGLLFQMRVRRDGQRTLLYISSGSLRVLRVTPDALMENASGMFDMCHPEDRPALDAAFLRLNATGNLQTSFRALSANGEVRWLTLHAASSRLADGSSVWHGYIEDVSEHAYMEQHRQLAVAPL